MGQIVSPTRSDILLTSVDRLTASNAGPGMNPAASHVILLGQGAGTNLGALSDIIALGFGALDAGIGNANFNGSIVMGRDAAGALNVSVSAGSAVIIGNRAANVMTRDLSNCVLIGEDVLYRLIGGGGSDTNTSVVIGKQAGGSTSSQLGSVRRSVMIGYQAGLYNQALQGDMTSCVFIGYQAGAGAFTAGSNACQFHVAVGDNAMAGAHPQGPLGNTALGYAAFINQSAGTVAIGYQVSSNDEINDSYSVVIGGNAANTSNGCVLIGGLAAISNANGDSCTHVGRSANVGGGTGLGNVGLGAFSAMGTNTATAFNRCIAIGYTAGQSLGGVAVNDILLIETDVGRMVYGKISNGNMILGNAANGDRNWRGTTQPTNAIKLVNGTVGTGTNPTTGGFFYVAAGVLRWFDQNGRDTTLSANILTVATLPAGATQGDRAFVTDALAPAWNTAVAGGGAVVTPVYYNGAAWTAG